jgi:2-oxoglutarate/2-oxoacid ferredoxin oxidoreductase subunit beta
MIDVLSPCVTFNDHVGSTKSYAYVKDHEEPLGEISFVPYFEDITIEYEPGRPPRCACTTARGSTCARWPRTYNPTDKHAALGCCRRPTSGASSPPASCTSRRTSPTLVDLLEPRRRALATLPLERVRPSRAALDEFMDSHR